MNERKGRRSGARVTAPLPRGGGHATGALVRLCRIRAHVPEQLVLYRLRWRGSLYQSHASACLGRATCPLRARRPPAARVCRRRARGGREKARSCVASSTKVPGATVYHHARHAAVSSGKRKGGGSGRRLGRSEASHGNDGRRVGSQRGVRGAKASDTEDAECGRSTAAPHTKQRSVSVRDRSARRPAICGRGNRHEKARRKRARKQRAAEHDASSFTVRTAL